MLPGLSLRMVASRRLGASTYVEKGGHEPTSVGQLARVEYARTYYVRTNTPSGAHFCLTDGESRKKEA